MVVVPTHLPETAQSRLSSKLNPKDTMHQPVTDSLSDSPLPDNLMPALYWKLGGNHG